MEIFAYRPAPVVMHYMGFGATIGASYVDYFLSDLVRMNTIFSCLRAYILVHHMRPRACTNSCFCVSMYVPTYSLLMTVRSTEDCPNTF